MWQVSSVLDDCALLAQNHQGTNGSYCRSLGQVIVHPRNGKSLLLCSTRFAYGSFLKEFVCILTALPVSVSETLLASVSETHQPHFPH